MLQIGRKIYYELATGNVILDTGERQGDVIETTEDQDFQIYTALQAYQQSAVGVVQCDYGFSANNFAKYPYHIAITKNPIDVSAIIWDTANPLGATLADAQAAKLAQINDLYNQKLTAGFTSNATGTAYAFGYGPTDREKFMQLAISVLSNVAAFPVPIPALDNSIVMHSQAQYQQLLTDINAFAWPLQNKLHDLISQVSACTTIDQVNAIVVSF